MEDNRKWIYIGTFESMGVSIDEYVCEETKECKQIFNDGHEEIFEIAE